MDYPKATELLPQRPPFLFVDEICGFSEGEKSVVCRLFVDSKMPFFKGHFPGDAVMPGALVQEALAQTSGVLLALLSLKNGEGKGMFYMASANVKFLSVVRPDGVLALKSALAGSFGGVYKFSVEALFGRAVAASGSLSLASSEIAK